MHHEHLDTDGRGLPKFSLHQIWKRGGRGGEGGAEKAEKESRRGMWWIFLLQLTSLMEPEADRCTLTIRDGDVGTYHHREDYPLAKSESVVGGGRWERLAAEVL
jgi:hypothetical protein